MFATAVVILSVVSPVVGSVGDEPSIDRTGAAAASSGAAASVADSAQCIAGAVNRTGSAPVETSEDGTVNYPDSAALDVARGDVAAIPLEIRQGVSADVTIRSQDGAYNVTVRYANNDGRRQALLYVNTYLAGNDSGVAGGTFEASGADRVGVTDRASAPGAPLPTGEYEAVIRAGDSVRRVALNVTDPEIGNVDVFRAPGEKLANLTTAEAIHRGRADGLVTVPPHGSDGPELAYGDTVVYRLDVSGIYGLMAAQDGDSAEAKFLSVVRNASGGDGAPIDLAIRTESSCQSVVDLGASAENGTLAVAPDPDNGTLYVATDHRRASYHQRSAGPVVGNADVTYTFSGGTYLADDDVTRQQAYRVRPRELTYDLPEGVLYRNATDGQRITGETSLAPGTELTLRAAEIDGSEEHTAETNVTADGAFNASLDLSDAPTDSRLALTVDEIGDTRTLLVTGNGTDAAIWFGDYESAAPIESVGGSQVALGQGGYLAAYRVPSTEVVEAEHLIGHSAYLEPGVHRPNASLFDGIEDSRNVVLVVHRDTDGDEAFDYPNADDPYRIDGDPLYQVGRVLVEGDTSTPSGEVRYLSVDLRQSDDVAATPNATATPDGNATATPETDETETPTATAEPTTESPTESPTESTTAEPTTEPTETPTTTTVPLPTTRPPETTAPGANGTAASPDGNASGTGTTASGDGAGFGPTLALIAVALVAAAATARRL